MVKDIKKRIFLFRKRMLYRLRAIKKVLSLLKMRKAIIKWYDRNSNLAIFQNHGQSNVSSGWSVVVVTDGKSPESLEKLIKSVDSELHDVPSEIIVVGRNSLPLNFKPIMEVRHIPYKELGLSPGWITFKKNIGAKVSKYDKLVMCHDYVYFMPGWKAGFDKFGYDFDVCMNKITDFEGERHLDWVANIPGIGKGLLPYHTEFTKYQYIYGIYFIVKRDFFLKNLLDQNRHWGDGEDIEWSTRVREKTTFKFNPHSSVTFSKKKKPFLEIWKINGKLIEEKLKQKRDENKK